MKNLLFTLLMMLCICNITTAQITFQKTFGSSDQDQGNYVQQTNDGGTLLQALLLILFLALVKMPI